VVDKPTRFLPDECATDLGLARHPNLCVVRTFFEKSHCLAGCARSDMRWPRPEVIGLFGSREGKAKRQPASRRTAAFGRLGGSHYLQDWCGKICASGVSRLGCKLGRSGVGWVHLSVSQGPTFSLREPRAGPGPAGPAWRWRAGFTISLPPGRSLCVISGGHALTSPFRAHPASGTRPTEMSVLQGESRSMAKIRICERLAPHCRDDITLTADGGRHGRVPSRHGHSVPGPHAHAVCQARTLRPRL